MQQSEHNFWSKISLIYNRPCEVVFTWHRVVNGTGAAFIFTSNFLRWQILFYNVKALIIWDGRSEPAAN